ncbi:leucine-rich repeat domain-containing protein [Cuspidothrix issatschenkoi LEGE 03284]|uniref:leucine-rich repeat domain-containing protein n=1 Tax=Cuspidothrix issatschenkoi TaxID=230752 RepID=UPI00188110A9|nr:leucine-rich repeat domain-containing protein [Cuspidothrix issatschenkoi]MBE9234081.1 leucine-rich repeat domain-containing protein [Cuspidothrix issatschenkoi LEGE 03284]
MINNNFFGRIVKNQGTELDLEDLQLTSPNLQKNIHKILEHPLTKLDIGENRLKILPTEIGQLVNLKILVVSNNQLRYLPSEIGELTNLETLDLSNNYLESLPPEIGRLRKLKNLYLKGNSLSLMPSEILKQGTRVILLYLQEQLQKQGVTKGLELTVDSYPGLNITRLRSCTDSTREIDYV